MRILKDSPTGSYVWWFRILAVRYANTRIAAPKRISLDKKNSCRSQFPRRQLPPTNPASMADLKRLSHDSPFDPTDRSPFRGAWTESIFRDKIPTSMAKRSRKHSRRFSPSPELPSKRESFRGLILCFFLSGAAALIYQILWTKALGLVFGHTAYALATVLAVFMAGLAAGSRWLGKWSEGIPRPLAAYGWLELAVAGAGALSLEGIAGVRFLYYLLSSENSSTTWLLAIRIFGATVVLFMPTFLMGGTFPMLVAALNRSAVQLEWRVARLYWVNATGAVVGTLAAGFFLLPALGMRYTLSIAVMLNILAGLIAMQLARKEAVNTKVRATLKSDPDRGNTTGRMSNQPAGTAPSPALLVAPPRSLPRLFLLICFAVVGATAMAYEIGWTRLLATQLGSSTYAFTIMLATFLAGIALGSVLFERWRSHTRTPMTFAWTQAATAIVSLPALILFNRLPDVLVSILSTNDQSFRTALLAQFAVSSLAMLPTAVVFGFNFPVVTLLTSEDAGNTGRLEKGNGKAEARAGSGAVGRAYAWNTTGAIAGAIAAGFWLLPHLGSFRLLVAAAAVNAGLATLLSIFWIFTGGPGALRARISAIGGLGLSLLVLGAIGTVGLSSRFDDPAVATFNTMLYWNAEGKPVPLPVRQKARMMDVIYSADGLNSTISVARTDDILALRTNGKTDASNSDIDTQLMLGHIGAIAHRAPRRILVIGFGAGMTLSALARYPEIERLDCVEIEPAVLRAAPLLRTLNRNVLNDKRVHIVYDDGRNFLLTTRNRYDLIVSEPSNPWIDGVASLFTREFYRAAQERLAPGGIFVQWVQSYSLYPDDLRMISATFLSEFQNATLWHGVKSDLILVAPTPPLPQMLKRMQTLWSNPSLRSDFEWMGIERPEGLFGYYLLDDSRLRNFAATGRINTDDRTSLEYSAPRSLLIRGLDEENLRELYEVQPPTVLPGFEGDQRDSALAASATTALNGGDIEDADLFLGALDPGATTSEDEIARGRDAIAHADYQSASQAFDLAFSEDSNSVEAAWGIAETNRLSGKSDLALQQLQRILEKHPNDLRTLTSLEQLYSDNSYSIDAADTQRRLIQADPRAGADAYAELGEMLKRAGRLDQAVVAMNQCLALDPYNFQTHLNLGQIFDVQKKYLDARKNLEFVQRFFPDVDPQTYALLFEVDNALGDSKAAADSVRFGLRLFPGDPDLLKASHSL
jgi:spermidine synthase